MRKYSLLTAAVITLGVSLAAIASAQTTSTPHKKIFGYQDAQTGDFHPFIHVNPDTATAPTTGKYDITFTVTLTSNFAAGTVIACEVDIEEDSMNTTTYLPVAYYTELAVGSTKLATADLRSTTCTVAIPYSWVIPPSTPTTKPPVVVTSSVSAGYTVSAINPSATLSEATIEGLRSSSSSIPISAKVPATGATTSATVDVTL